MFYGWRIVGAALVSLTVSVGPIIGLTLGVFLIPLMAEFAWSRAEAAQGVSLGLLGFTVAQPIYGRLIGRYGAKRIIAASALCFGVSLWGLACFVDGTRTFYLGTLVTGLLAGGTSPLPWGTILSHWFRRQRGRALSIALCGLAIGGIVLPLMVSSLIAAYGWRAAFAALGTLTIVIILPTVMRVVRDTPAEMGLLADGEAPDGSIKNIDGIELGYSFKQARGRATFWIMAAGLFLITSATQGAVVHLAPLVVDHGFSFNEAASLVSLLSVGFLPGLFGSGYLIDRYSPRGAASVFYTAPILAFIILGQASALSGLAVSALLLGVGIGATIQLIPTLVGWCFGLRSFAEIYGAMMVAFGLGLVGGPLLIGWLWDKTGSYAFLPGSGAGVVTLAVCLVSVVRRHE